MSSVNASRIGNSQPQTKKHVSKSVEQTWTVYQCNRGTLDLHGPAVLLYFVAIQKPRRYLEICSLCTCIFLLSITNELAKASKTVIKFSTTRKLDASYIFLDIYNHTVIELQLAPVLLDPRQVSNRVGCKKHGQVTLYI